MPVRRSFRKSTVFDLLRASLLPMAVAISASTAAAQQAASLPNSIVATSSSLSARDSQTVADFVANWTTQIAEGGPLEVNKARGELISPARSPSATPIFTRAYSEAVVPALGPLVSGDDTFRAINALQVARFLKSPEAVELIVVRVDPTEESDRAKRLVASGLLAAAIRDGQLNPVQLDGTTRRIASIAGTEADWMVLLQLMEALDAIANLPNTPQASIDLARRSQLTVLEATVSRMKGPDGNPELIEAIYRSLLELRNQLVRMSSSQRSAFSRQFGPVFASVESAAKAGLATAPANLKPIFEKTAEQAKVLADLTRG
jgi:hypothetical protein